MDEPAVSQSGGIELLQPLLLWQDLHLSRLLPTLTAGFISGLLTITLELSFAALIFSGPLSGFLVNGIGLVLFGGFVIGIVAVLTSSFPATVAFPQASPVAILAAMSAAIAGAMAPSTTEDIYVTVVAAIALTSLLTGAFSLVLGCCRLGNLIRFLPYPVVGGFVAGIGWLLVQGGFSVMTGTSLALSHVPELLEWNTAARWLPGVVFAVLLLALLRRHKHFLIMPGMLLAASGLFHLICYMAAPIAPDARLHDWLLGPLPTTLSWQPLTLAALAHVDWSAMSGQIFNVCAIPVVSVMSLLCMANGLELTVGQEIDLNRELKSTGIANLVAGLGASPVGHQGLALSALGYRLGSNSRLVGLLSAVSCGTALLLGASTLSLFPRFVLGGLLLYLGLAFLIEWLIDAWFKLSRIDYLLALLTLLFILALGFLPGVAAGVCAGAIMFTINYSRIDVVKQALSGGECPSRKGRCPEHRRLLWENREKLQVLTLQGFLFFGTANTLLDRIQSRLYDPDLVPLRFLVLDFSETTGLDSSAVSGFVRLRQLAGLRNVVLAFAQVPSAMVHQLRQGVGAHGHEPGFCLFPDLERAIEWCEDQILTDEAGYDTVLLPQELAC